MDLPWPQILLGSIVGTLGLVQFAPNYSILNSYLGTFSVLFVILFIAGILWRVILWPKLFSPIRHLPSPPVGVVIPHSLGPD